MEKAQIERINQLAKKQRETGLTEEEKAEQAQLRKQYLDEFRAGMENVLAGVKIQRPDGTFEPIRKKES